MLPLRRTKVDIFDINIKLHEACIKNNFEFNDHQQITRKYLWKDGIQYLWKDGIHPSMKLTLS